MKLFNIFMIFCLISDLYAMNIDIDDFGIEEKTEIRQPLSLLDVCFHCIFYNIKQKDLVEKFSLLPEDVLSKLAQNISKLLVDSNSLIIHQNHLSTVAKLPKAYSDILSQVGQPKDNYFKYIKKPLDWKLFQIAVSYHRDCFIRFDEEGNLIIIDDKYWRKFDKFTYKEIKKVALPRNFDASIIKSVDKYGKRMLKHDLEIYDFEKKKIIDKCFVYREHWLSNDGRYRISYNNQKNTLEIYNIDTNDKVYTLNPINKSVTRKNDKIAEIHGCSLNNNKLCIIRTTQGLLVSGSIPYKTTLQLINLHTQENEFEFEYEEFITGQRNIMLDNTVIATYSLPSADVGSLICCADSEGLFKAENKRNISGAIKKIVINPLTKNLLVANGDDNSLNFYNQKLDKIFSFITTENNSQVLIEIASSPKDNVFAYEIDWTVQVYPTWDAFDMKQMLYLNALDFALYDMHQWEKIDMNVLQDDALISTFPKIMQTNIKQRLEVIQNHQLLATSNDLGTMKNLAEAMCKKISQKNFLSYIDKYRLIESYQLFPNIVTGIAKKLVAKKQFYHLEKNKTYSGNIYNYCSKNISQQPNIIDRIYSNSYTKAKKVKPSFPFCKLLCED